MGSNLLHKERQRQMKIRITLELSKIQTLDLVGGRLRDDPRKPWRDKEIKEHIREMVQGFIDDKLDFDLTDPP